MPATRKHLAAFVVLGLTGMQAAAVPLTQVIELRHLSQQEAARGVAIRLKGVVTDLSGYSNSFFFQDETSGISVDRTDHAEVRLGDEVELTGTSGPGRFAPTVLASQVRVLGHGTFPVPRRVAYGDMFGGAQDSQWIEVEGVIHSARPSQLFGHDVLMLSLDLGGGAVRLILQDFQGMDYGRLVDATVRVRGVCATTFNEKRQFVGLRMFVPNRRDLEVLQAARADPFAMPAVAVRDALQFGQGRHRVKVTGIVTYQVPGHTLYLQEGADGIRIQSGSTGTARPGERVEVVGFPAMGEYSPILEDSVFRVTGTGAPVTPQRILARDVITQEHGFDSVPYDQQVVQLQGKLVESRMQGGQWVWLLRQDNDVFEAHLPVTDEPDRMHDLGVGSVVLLTGVCAVEADADRNPVSFGILLRTPQDVVVLKSAPWWTPGRSVAVFVALTGAVVLVFLWVVVLRKRVDQQTRIIREREKSFRYLAEHDGLTGLLNRAAILLLLEREIERCRRLKTGVTIVLCDIDHFKRVNDTRGHLAGDAALRRFATALAASVRVDDFVGRYGGEEFMVVIPGILPHQVEERLEALHGKISNLSVLEQQAEFKITCSLGATFIPPGPYKVDGVAVLGATDRALYQAKEMGRNRVVFRSLTREIA